MILSFIICVAISSLLHGAIALQQPETSCNTLVDQFVKDHGRHVAYSNVSDAFIFFLHVPRTAGKTYASCFLRAAVRPSQRCAPSYDFLRLNVSQEGCRYLVSHDDYSLTSQLPDNTVVVTQLRDPLTRVLSAYEFAIEVAARRVKQDNDVFYSKAKNSTFVNTLNVWPWSYLVRWFRRDMQTKMIALAAEADKANSTQPRIWTSQFDTNRNRTYYWSKHLNQSVWTLPDANNTLDPYDNVLVTPLKEWLESDVARELVHDGATLQILGLTNYSHWQEATALRSCYFQDANARKRLADLAKDRLRSMQHVGLTEDLDISVASLAAGLGQNLSSPSYRAAARNVFSYDAPDFDIDQSIQYNASRKVPEGVMTTITVKEARRLLIELEREITTVSGKLNKLEPKLQELVDKEDAWLQDEFEKKNSDDIDDSGDDEEEDYFSAEAKEGSTAAGSGELVEVGGGVKGAVSKVTAWLRSLVDWPPAAEASSAGSEGGQTENTEDLEDQHDDEEESVDQGNEKIDSPWAQEIEALDAQVYPLQQHRDGLQRDVAELLANPLVKGPETPQGRAKLLLPERDFVDSTPLGETYRRCSKGATKRAADKRRGAFKDLVTPWHESFGFSSQARRNLAPELVQRIRKLNAVDVELWELGKELLKKTVEEQKAAGMMEELPLPEASKEESKKGTQRRPSGSGVKSTTTKSRGWSESGASEATVDDSPHDEL